MAIYRVPILIAFPGAGSPGANIWHIRTAGPAGSVDLGQANALIGFIRTFYNSILTHIPAATAITLGTVVEEETSVEIAPTMAVLSGSGTGSAPQALACVVTWRTTLAARRGRGRTFVGPLATAAMQNDGTPAAATRTAIQDAAAALVTASMGYGNGAVGVYGYDGPKTPGKENPRNPDDPKVFRDFIGSGVRDVFGVLRSRRD